MLCPYCTQETKVLESRIINNSVRRRRECLDCSSRFTTYEKAEFNFTVRKKDGREQPFDQNKITESLRKACNKENEEKILHVSRVIETKLLSKKKNHLTTEEIGEVVLNELKKFDKIAYVRFASIHKGIDDPRMLQKEVSRIAKKRD